MEITQRQITRFKQIKSLDMLRGLACLLVVLCHTEGTEFGQTGVDFFLVISGFMMMLSTDKAEGIQSYWIKRIKRIVPLYYGVTMFTTLLVVLFPFLFHSYEVSIEYVVKSLLFIPYYHNGIPGPIMALGWTLNYEMFFYLIFYIASVFSFKYRGITTCVILATYSALGKIVNLPFVLDYYSDPIIIEFCFGIIAYCLYKQNNGKNIIQNRKAILNTISIATIVVAVVFMNHLMNLNSTIRGITVGLVAFVIVVILSIFDNQLVQFEVMTRLGKDSYQIYLLHPFIVRGIDLILGKFIEHNLMTSAINLLISTIIIEIIVTIWRRNYAIFIKKQSLRMMIDLRGKRNV